MERCEPFHFLSSGKCAVITNSNPLARASGWTSRMSESVFTTVALWTKFPICQGCDILLSSTATNWTSLFEDPTLLRDIFMVYQCLDIIWAQVRGMNMNSPNHRGRKFPLQRCNVEQGRPISTTTGWKSTGPDTQRISILGQLRRWGKACRCLSYRLVRKLYVDMA